jgi:DNA-binding transcriptional MerR regulator
MQDQVKKGKQTNKIGLSLIPDKLYFTIGEVAKLCEIKPHVLRYWEQEFEQLRPSKRRGNRRYYQRKDVVIVAQIKELLYQKGFTIEGARTQLQQIENDDAIETSSAEPLQQMVSELEKLLLILEG